MQTNLPPGDVEDAYPLSRLQAGMLFHNAYDPEYDVAIYHDIFGFRLKARFDLGALQAASRQLAARHAVLRTSFDLERFSQPVQLVHRRVDLPVQVEDLRGLLAGAQEAALKRWAETEKNHPFDWGRPPLLRFQVHLLTESTFQFTMSFHHAILDGWSVASMLTELVQIYRSLLRQETPLLKPPPQVEFKEFVACEQQAIRSEACRQYWTDRLKDSAVTTVMRWPRVSSKGPRQVPQQEIPVSPEVSDGLKQLARRIGVPLKSVLLAAHLRVLSLISGQLDVVTGLTSNGRPEAKDGERTLGLFLNTLPLRLKLPGGTWIDLIRETYQAEQELLPFRHYPLAEMQKALGGVPLEASFNFVNFHVYQSLAAFDEVQLVGGDVFEETNFTFLVNASLNLYNQQVQLEIRYEAAALGDNQIRAIGGYYLQALSAMIQAPEARYERQSLLSPQEQQQLFDWNAPECATSPEACIHELYEAQARQRPEAVAAVFEEQWLTYGALNRRANQVARHLRTLGVGPEVCVGLCVERSLEMLIGLLGILKAGGTYLPLDPAYPAERLAFMLADTRAPVLLTQASLVPALPAHPAQVVCLDTDWPSLAHHPDTNPPADAAPGTSAYIIYTSGSTGRPKGVVVCHANMIRLFTATQPWFHFDERDVWTLFHSFAFDFSVWEMWGAWLYGGRVVVVPHAVSRASELFYDLLSRHQVTVLNQIPTAFRQLIQVEDQLAAPQRLGLRWVIFGGEALSLSSLQAWFDRHGDQQPKLVNMYGITETTVHVTWRPVTQADLHSGAGSVIGQAIPDLRLYILDPESRQPVPIGVPGELYVGGAGLARGYLGRPELTAERFIPDPWSQTPGARLYKTGDLARYLPGGDLEYGGRIDHQVKVRGYRIELGEIEHTLDQHPAVQHSAVILREVTPGLSRLVGYVVPDLRHARPVRQLLHFEREDLLGDRRPCELPNGMVILQRNKSETEFVYREIFEDQSYLRHGITLTDGGCVFDVGANTGLFTLFVRQRCPHAKIFAFEPIPPVFETLRLNTQLYCDRGDVHLFAAGLAGEPATARLTYYPNVSILSSRFAEAAADRELIKAFVLSQAEREGAEPDFSGDQVDELLAERLTTEQFECPFTTLSEIIRMHGVERIDLLKIDVEKSELDVLAGIHDGDWDKIEQVVVEVHGHDGRLATVVALLQSHGFETVAEQETTLRATDLYNVYAVRPGHSGRSVAAVALAVTPEPTWSSATQLRQDLRNHLQGQLPDYMVPASIIFLDAFPLTPSGKVDQRALPLPDSARPELKKKLTAPRTPIEEQLVKIWKEVLRLDPIGVDDNFFEIGGDSILSLQITARACRIGLRIAPGQIFSHQTIAELATVVSPLTPAPPSHGLLAGPVPLTPVQHRFFEQILFEPDQDHQSVLLQVPHATDPTWLAHAFQRVWAHHDALRLRFVLRETGWEQFHADSEERVSVLRIDLSALDRSAQASALEAAVAALQASLHLFPGPLGRVALFDLGLSQESRLLIVIHPLVVDSVSWHILLQDLQRAYQQLVGGEPIQLPPKTSSYKAWAERLNQCARSEALDSELEYWLTQAQRPIPDVPVDLRQPDAGSRYASARTLAFSLTAEETHSLLHDVLAAYHTSTIEVLLAALAQAFALWTGSTSFLVDLATPGREDRWEDLDISRTVGGFTAVVPVRLDLPPEGDARSVLLAIKEQFRRIPSRGFGYGLLRYLRGDASIVQRLDALQAKVSFNYSDQFDLGVPESSLFALARDSSGPAYRWRKRPYPLEIDAMLVAGQLRVRWAYRETLYRRDTIERLAQNFCQALRALIVHCQSPRAGTASPADFVDVDLTQEKLDKILAELDSLEA